MTSVMADRLIASSVHQHLIAINIVYAALSDTTPQCLYFYSVLFCLFLRCRKRS